MSKVFVSSTVFDLLDARAEVEYLLREMRLVPILSGSATSGFQPRPDQNSIETCLTNLRQCDAVIVILCHRYGPTLETAGYPDVSATHLEYNEGRKVGKPIHMYVRDRLEADYCIYKKNTEDNVRLLWVRDESDQRLFDLLAEHRKLAKDKPGSNWFDTFRDSSELKTLIKRDFGPLASRSELVALVVENRVPIVTVRLDIERSSTPASCAMMIRIILRNVGTVPAYRLSWALDGNDDVSEMPLLAPQEETLQTLIYGYDGKPWERMLNVTYFLSQGHRVHDEHRVGFRPLGGEMISSGASSKSKSYHVAAGDAQPFVIVDD